MNALNKTLVLGIICLVTASVTAMDKNNSNLLFFLNKERAKAKLNNFQTPGTLFDQVIEHLASVDEEKAEDFHKKFSFKR